MRESIGGSYIFSVVIIFILLFTAFLAITINYSKSFVVKNDVIDIVEREEGLTDKAIKLINGYLTQSGYNNTGKCGKNSIGGNADGTVTQIGDNGSKDEFRYCVQKHNKFNKDEPNRAYYSITLFFDMDLPVFGNILTFRATGETTEIYYSGDCDRWGECN